MLRLILAAALAPQVSVDEAMRMAGEGRLPEAESALRRLAAASPRDPDPPYRLGLVLVKQGRPEEGARELERATGLDPTYAFAWLALADARLRSGNRVQALEAALQAQKRAGEAPPAWKALALLRNRLADPEGELAALERLAALSPADRATTTRLAALLIERRDHDRALQVSEAATRRFPSDAELLRLHGLALYGLGRKQPAVDAFLAAMDAAPDSDLVHASIETLLADAGTRGPAILERLRRFHGLKPASPLGPYLIALAGGAEKEAQLRAALKLDASFWPAWFELHKILREAGKRPEAIEALEATLRLNANHEGAHFALAELYLEAGDRAKARHHRAEHHRLRAAAAH